MNRQRAKDLLPIIKAFAENRPIERRTIGETNWADTNQICLQLYEEKKIEYRIKPEPKYRPFKTREECWEEMHKHSDFGWLKSKQSGSFATIGAIIQQEEDSVRVRWSTNETQNFTASAVFNDYTFTDGTPFGVKEEGK